MKQKNIYDLVLCINHKMFDLAICNNGAILSVALFDIVLHSDCNTVSPRQWLMNYEKGWLLEIAQCLLGKEVSLNADKLRSRFLFLFAETMRLG